MSKTLKKLLLLLVVGCMSVFIGLFAACSDPADSSNNGGNDNVNNSQGGNDDEEQEEKFDYAAGYPELEDKQEVTVKTDRDDPDGAFELPRDKAELTLGEATKLEGFNKSFLVEWTVDADELNGLTGLMLRSSYSTDSNDSDDYLRTIVYYVGLTTADGTTWTYNQPPKMGGVMCGINLAEGVTKVSVVLEYTGEGTFSSTYPEKSVYVTLAVNDKAGH